MKLKFEREILGAIECHEIFGEHRAAKKLREKYEKFKNRNLNKENKLKVKKRKVFEGILMAAGWDRTDEISQSCLSTKDDEDILLMHEHGMEKFTPYLNEKVRIWGEVTSGDGREKRVFVKKIRRLVDKLKAPYEINPPLSHT